MSHTSVTLSQSLAAGTDGSTAGRPAADETGLRISHHDQWAMPEATMAAFSYICLVEAIGTQAV